MLKRALCVGVDYVGQAGALNGCASDAYAWAQYLSDKGYEITLLVDDSKKDQRDGRFKVKGDPTRANILTELMSMVASDATHIFFTFSGHGSQKWDQFGYEEADDKDEVLCPMDYADTTNGGYIRDDAVRGVWQSLRPTQKVRGFYDCCHSGGGMDLPYRLYDRGGTHFRFFDNGHDDPTHGEVVLISGCRADKVSMEVSHSIDFNDPQMRGAVTVSTLEVLTENDRVSLASLLGTIRRKVRKLGSAQIPQLSSGQSVSPYMTFMP